MWIVRKDSPDLGCVTVALPLLIIAAAAVFHIWQVHHAREDAQRVASEKILWESADPRSYEGMFERPLR